MLRLKRTLRITLFTLSLGACACDAPSPQSEPPLPTSGTEAAPEQQKKTMENSQIRPGGVRPMLAKPIATRFIDISDVPTRGAAADDALVTIVEVGDYGCPDTLDAEPFMQRVIKEYPTSRWYFAPAKFDKRPAGIPMTELAVTGILEGKFWETHDLIWKNFKQTDQKTITAMKTTLGFDETTVYEYRPLPRGNKLYDEAQLSWVPTFFVNGIAYYGETLGPLTSLIEDQLTFAKIVQEETGLRGEALYAELVKRNQE